MQPGLTEPWPRLRSGGHHAAFLPVSISSRRRRSACSAHIALLRWAPAALLGPIHIRSAACSPSPCGGGGATAPRPVCPAVPCQHAFWRFAMCKAQLRAAAGQMCSVALASPAFARLATERCVPTWPCSLMTAPARPYALRVLPGGIIFEVSRAGTPPSSPLACGSPSGRLSGAGGPHLVPITACRRPQVNSLYLASQQRRPGGAVVLALRRGAAPPPVSAVERFMSAAMTMAAAQGRPGTHPAIQVGACGVPLPLPATGCRIACRPQLAPQLKFDTQSRGLSAAGAGSGGSGKVDPPVPARARTRASCQASTQQQWQQQQ